MRTKDECTSTTSGANELKAQAKRRRQIFMVGAAITQAVGQADKARFLTRYHTDLVWDGVALCERAFHFGEPIDKLAYCLRGMGTHVCFTRQSAYSVHHVWGDTNPTHEYDPVQWYRLAWLGDAGRDDQRAILVPCRYEEAIEGLPDEPEDR